MFKKILTAIIIGILAIPALVMAINITVPSAPGAGYLLISTTTGAYVASSTLLSGIVTSPAGSDTQLQWNNAGAFGASNALYFSSSTQNLFIVSTTSNDYPDLLTLQNKAAIPITLGGTGTSTGSTIRFNGYFSAFPNLSLARITGQLDEAGTGAVLIFGTGILSSTEKMRINNVGSVLIGTTTDNGFGLLQVNGTSTMTALNVKSLNTTSEARVTNGDYSRLVRASSSNQTNLYNIVSVIGADGTGGTITHSGAYTIHTFTSTGSSTLVLPAGVTTVEVLLVGGGGGGAILGGGGGAGGILYNSAKSISGSVAIYVGAGGNGAGNAPGTIASSGQNTTFSNDMVAFGGGGGASQNYSGNGAAGGSGGGTMPGVAGTSTQTSNGGGIGYGNAGGLGVPAAASSGGGGGGASATGTAGLAGPNRGGAGGAGMAFAISGATTTYAGGGGGGAQSGTGGAGGAGGGGAGSGSAANGANGTANTGGGGGSTGYAGGYGNGGSGGSGIVIVRYIPATTNYETSILKSINSSVGGIGGKNTLSDDLADTHLTGNILSFDIAGVNKATLSNSGYLGIGTTTPIALLHIVNSTAGSSATSTIAIGSGYSGIGKLCFWNGSNYTIESFASNSITPLYATSTSCQ